MKTRSTLTMLLLAILLGMSALVALAAPSDDPSAPAVLAAPRDVCVSNGTGNWGTAGTWTCGHVPTGSDIVIINNGHTVTLNTNGSAYQLIVGGGTSGTLTHGTDPQTLTVGAGGVSVSNGATFSAPEVLTINGNLSINSGGIFNGGNATINIQGNLTNNGTLNAGTSMIVMNGSGGAQNIGGSGPLNFYKLTIGNSAGVNLTTSATVTLLLELQLSDLNVSSGYTLTMASGAAISGNYDVVGVTYRSGLVAGTSYSFGSPYTTITFNGSGGPSELAVKLIKSAPNGLCQPVLRHYQIITSTSTVSYDLRLHYRNSELNGNDESKIQMWEQVNGLWTLRPATGRSYSGTDDNWVEKTGITTGGLNTFWALAESGCPTAVTLSTFEARADAPSALPFIGLGALAVVMLGVVVWRRTMCQ